MKTINSSDRKSLEALKGRRSNDFESVIQQIRPIVAEVKQQGDAALKQFARKFDALELSEIRVSQQRRKSARPSQALREALQLAKENIIKFHTQQMPKEWWCEIQPGIEAGQLVRPLGRVGCYIPGGRYPLVSTILMTVLPAKVAGVKEVIVCTPKATPEILVACEIAGVDQIYEVGGAGAIAAMAYGTESIPKVDKIVGPGSLYVAAAKKLVYGEVGIDFIAGPSEIVVIADQGANPVYIAADLLAQAEHDVASMALLITPSLALAEEVRVELSRQLQTLPTRQTAQASLEQNGAIILVESLEEAIEISNFFAPEHVVLFCDDPLLLAGVENAGSVFLGEYSPEAAGDYASGPNHVLPTGGFASAQSGLSVRDFIKTPTVQRLSKAGLKQISNSVVALAEAEGLTGHAQSIKVRMQ